MPDDPKRFAVAMTEYSKEKVLGILYFVIYLYKAIIFSSIFKSNSIFYLRKMQFSQWDLIVGPLTS
jgi:hypothetical protein